MDRSSNPAGGVEETQRMVLPPDCVWLPLTRGQLLVSRTHAVFCRIPDEHRGAVQQVLDGVAGPDALPDALLEELRRHGFSGGPRPAKPPTHSVQIQLTNACNLACSYCCTNSGAPRRDEVQRDAMFSVVDQVVEVMGPGTQLALLGGEPLLVPWSLDLAEHAVDKGLVLTLFTNGLLLADAGVAARVAALMKRGASVRVSLAGATSSTCDAASGAPRFDRVVAGLHQVASHGVLPIIDLMLLPDQVEEIAVHLPELRKVLPPGMKLALGIAYLSGRERGAHLFQSRSDLETALDRIAFEAGESIAAPAPSPVAERREGCSCALGHHLHVRSDGSLFTCFKMEEKVGDLRNMSFGEGLRKLRASARPARTLPRCADCALATLCGGGCRSENLQFTGDADEPVCGPWRVRVLGELLAEDRVTALEWPALQLLAEARARGIEAPEKLDPVLPSRHLVET